MPGSSSTSCHGNILVFLAQLGNCRVVVSAFELPTFQMDLVFGSMSRQASSIFGGTYDRFETRATGLVQQQGCLAHCSHYLGSIGANATWNTRKKRLQYWREQQVQPHTRRDRYHCSTLPAEYPPYAGSGAHVDPGSEDSSRPMLQHVVRSSRLRHYITDVSGSLGTAARTSRWTLE